MDTHNAHDIFVFPDQICLAEIHIVFLQFINIAHKMKQSLVTGIFIGDRLSPPALKGLHDACLRLALPRA